MADLQLGVCLSGRRYTWSRISGSGHIVGDVQRSSVGLGKNYSSLATNNHCQIILIVDL